MNFIDFPFTTRAKIKEFLKSEYKIIPLKKTRIRILKMFHSPENRSPNPFLLITPNKKKYKAQVSPFYLPENYKLIYDINDVVKTLGFTPEIRFKSNNLFLSDYIDGNFPDPSKKQFTIDLAKIFAELHNLSQKKIKINERLPNNFAKTLFGNVYAVNGETKTIYERIYELITKINKLQIKDIKYQNKLFELLEKQSPKEIIFGYTYSDHNLTNYLYQKDKLFLIDYGSFRANHPLDFDLVGSSLFNKIDEKTFWKNYLDSGGLKIIYDNRYIFKIFGLLIAINYNFERGLAYSKLDFRRRNSRFQNVKKHLVNLYNILEIGK